MLSSDGAFLYCNAGHNAPLHITASSIRRLETGGIVLGLFDPASFDEETVKLQPGDLIVAFSDGITEALNPAGEEFTDDRLLASVEAHKHRTPQELLDALMADVRLFCADANQSDDMTIVMVRYDGNSPVPVS